MKKIVLAVIVSAFVLSSLGCSGMRARKEICEGLLSVGQTRNSIQAVWGLPTRASTMTGSEIMEASIGAFGKGSFFKGKTGYEVWTYEDKATTLVFEGRKHRLVTWDTKKTVAELAAMAPKENCTESF